MKAIFILLIGLAPLGAAGQAMDSLATVKVVDSLLTAARGLLNAGKFQEALPLAQQAAEISKQKWGENNARYAMSILRQAYGYASLGQNDKAESLYLKAKAIQEKTIGEDHLDYGKTMFNLGNLYYDKRDYLKAEPYFLKTKTIREKVLGKESQDYAWCTFKLAWINAKQQHFELADSLFQETKVIREKVLGKGHPDYITCINDLGLFYRDIGRLKEAEAQYIEMLEVLEKTTGRDTRDYAKGTNNLAVVYRIMGRYSEAERFFLKAKAIYEQKLDKESTSGLYAANLNSLANLYSAIERYDLAEPLFQDAAKIWGKTFGKNSWEYGSVIANLAGAFVEMARYDQAEPLYIEALNIMGQKQGKEHTDYAKGLYNLGTVYKVKGQCKQAEEYYLKGISIYEKKMPYESVDYGEAISNLASLYMYPCMGRYAEAEALLLKAKAIYEAHTSRHETSYLRLLRDLSIVKLNLGQFEASEKLLKQALELGKTSIGGQNKAYLQQLYTMVELYRMTKQLERCPPLLHEADSIEKKLLIGASGYMSQRELAQYQTVALASKNQLGSLVLDKPGLDIHLQGAMLNDALFEKGFLLNSAQKLERMAFVSDSTVRLSFLQWKDCQRNLAKSYSLPIQQRGDVSVLETQANILEKDLFRSIAGFGESMRQVNWKEVQANLKQNEAIVEFVHFQYAKPEPTDSTMYAALLLRSGDTQPLFIPLFEEKELLPLLRGAMGGSNFIKINALYAQKTAENKYKSLYELIWKPLKSLLAGAKTVYCSPSGLLHRINLAAIQTNDGQVFGDNYQLVLLGSTRQLVVPNNLAQSSTNDAYLAGGIRYATDRTAIAYANRGASGSRSITQSSVLTFQPDSLSATRGGVLDYLPATAAEVREIGQTLAAAGIRAKVDTGFYATEEAFRQLGVGAPSPRIVHLATHGYFFPDPVSKGQKANSNFGQEPVFKMSDYPMIRSGLILAGAKQAWLTGKHPQGQEDGILTAYEISQMNLSGTELVVLSACETGLGDILGNEGVYGLQRAFKIAGAKYLVMSLWKVDDRSTQEFMTAFYRHWLMDKQPVPQAFRAAQRELRAKRAGAYDWAGFVLIE